MDRGTVASPSAHDFARMPLGTDVRSHPLDKKCRAPHIIERYVA
jgi:hypothetical protein